MANTERPMTGLECKLYYNATTHASPTWTEITRAINVSFTCSKGEADQSSRVSDWKMTKGTLKDLQITFTYRKKQGTDTVFDALIAAVFADTVMEYAVLDGASTLAGVQGIRAFCEIMSVGNTQDLEGSEEVEFTLKPTYKEESSAVVEPDWYEVS